MKPLIMVVDDEPGVRELIGDALRAALDPRGVK